MSDKTWVSIMHIVVKSQFPSLEWNKLLDDPFVKSKILLRTFAPAADGMPMVIEHNRNRDEDTG